MQKLYCVVCGKYKKFKSPKIYISEKRIFLLFAVSLKMKVENFFKKKSQLRY